MNSKMARFCPGSAELASVRHGLFVMFSFHELETGLYYQLCIYQSRTAISIDNSFILPGVG
jgi:hypothetical protein